MKLWSSQQLRERYINDQDSPFITKELAKDCNLLDKAVCEKDGRIAELERELAWVRTFPLTDGHAMAIGQYELLQRIKDHLASKPPDGRKPQ